jgi:branched-chain amino acid aminotransferase
MSEAPLLDAGAWRRALSAARRSYHDGYYAMYTNAVGGIVTDPALMLVPADDHVVHRGDGVFETIKCVDGAVYALDRHLARLAHSAETIGLLLPVPRDALAGLVVQTLRAGGRRDALARVIVSRGPGGFGVNPYECPRPGLYIVAYALPPSFMDANPSGARLRSSTVPVKPGVLATIKTCNYLPNALMKKEAVDAGADFAVAFDERGFLAEGATENFGMVSSDRRLRVPGADRILSGITMHRALELAEDLVRAGALAGIETGDIGRRDLEGAAEILVFGTTPDVTAGVEWDGRPVGDGRPGPVQRELNRRLQADIRSHPAMRTPAFG